MKTASFSLSPTGYFRNAAKGGLRRCPFFQCGKKGQKEAHQRENPFDGFSLWTSFPQTTKGGLRARLWKPPLGLHCYRFQKTRQRVQRKTTVSSGRPERGFQRREPSKGSLLWCAFGYFRRIAKVPRRRQRKRCSFHCISCSNSSNTKN